MVPCTVGSNFYSRSRPIVLMWRWSRASYSRRFNAMAYDVSHALLLCCILPYSFCIRWNPGFTICRSRAGNACASVCLTSVHIYDITGQIFTCYIIFNTEPCQKNLYHWSNVPSTCTQELPKPASRVLPIEPRPNHRIGLTVLLSSQFVHLLLGLLVKFTELPYIMYILCTIFCVNPWI